MAIRIYRRSGPAGPTRRHGGDSRRPLFLVAVAVPRPLFLQSVALVALAIAAASALLAWRLRARRHGEKITLWDVAGAFTLIGCAAAMLSEPEAIFTTIGPTTER